MKTKEKTSTKCKSCSVDFTMKPRTKMQMYCTPQCRARHEYLKRFPNAYQKLDDKPCQICEKLFSPKYKGNIYCSKKCADYRYSIDFLKNKPDLFTKERLASTPKATKFLRLRVLILDRDNYSCRYCGRSPMKETGVVLHVDHKIPRSKGGEDKMENLISSCFECNEGKGDVILEFWKKQKVDYENQGKNIY
jgi:hypothetical protein